MNIYEDEGVRGAAFMLLKCNWILTSSQKPKEEWEAHFGPIVLNLDVLRNADNTVYEMRMRSAGWVVKFYVYRTPQSKTIATDGFYVGFVFLQEGDPELFERDLFILKMCAA